MHGGRRSGAGRPSGALGKKTIAKEEAAREAACGLPDDYTSLALLRAVYRNDSVAMSTRLQAARDALPYEHARLTHHTGNVNLHEFVYQCGPNKSLSIKPAKSSGHTTNGANGSASGLPIDDAARQ